MRYYEKTKLTNSRNRKNIPNMKEMTVSVQEAPRTSNRLEQKIKSSGLRIIKLPNVQNKEKLLKATEKG